MNTLDLISRGDIVRTAPPRADVPTIPLYQSNGRFGACAGPWGLHVAPDADHPGMHGRTRFMHMVHHVRARFGGDYLLPLAQLHWRRDPEGVREYRQHQSFADGTVTTRFAAEGWAATITTWFDPIERDLMGCEVVTEGDAPDILCSPLTDLRVHYDQEMAVDVATELDGDTWTAQLRCLNAATSLCVRTNAAMAEEGGALRLSLSPGRTWILIGVNGRPVATPEESRARTTEWWHGIWNGGLWLDLPDATAHALWVRSLAYIHCSYNDDGLGLPPPMGMAGCGWPFAFPQDDAYIHPVLLAAGRLDTARAWVERFARDIDGMRAYTRRITGADGILCPWVYPYGPFEGYHNPEPPNRFYHETHNSGYLCRMADETARMGDDLDWTRAHAVPIIHETAAFYADICRKGDDGLWHIHITPSMGQDERGGENQADYLCALFSARYCLETAVRYGLDETGRYAAILRDGLAFAPLLHERGFYVTCRDAGPGDIGHQKHPPQLNPLAFLPLFDAPDAPSISAYRRRYDLTDRAREPFFHGWTLGEFLLAGARLGDADGWLRDWETALPARYVDADWIQIYETSDNFRSPFYTTTHGLFAQAIHETLVSTWWGRLDVGRGFPWREPVRFGGLRTLFGVEVGGAVSAEGYDLTCRAQRDTVFTGPYRENRLKRNEELRLTGGMRPRV